MPVRRQDPTGIKNTNSGKVAEGTSATGIKHFGSVRTHRCEIPKGFHEVIVPIDSPNMDYKCVDDYLELGYTEVSRDPKLVGRRGHAVMICPNKDYAARSKKISDDSNPDKYAFASNQDKSGDTRSGQGPANMVIERGRPVSLAGETIYEGTPSQEYPDTPEEFAQGVEEHERNGE